MTDKRHGGPLDGNTLAGPLSEVFAGDVTTATVQCAGCGQVGVIARLRVYAHAPGLIARCPQCDEVTLRLVRSPDRVWLDLRGSVYLEVPLR
jgi:hypothetical protein